MGGGALAVADLDGDGDPEVLVAGSGLHIIDHDGLLAAPIDAPVSADASAIHDIDGDDVPEALAGDWHSLWATTAALAPLWTIETDGWAGDTTAFDFLGDGTAEVLYATTTRLAVYDGAGNQLFAIDAGNVSPVQSPVVVDVDNDGSAEIVVVSNDGYDGTDSPLVQVIRDVEDRWIPARRIWNQNAYHVTDVREDGTIPQIEPKHWLELNTFGTQAQIEAGAVCDPEPAG